MSFDIQVASKFKKQLKKLVKKYPSIKNEYAELINSLEQDPIQGTAIGHDCYKIRLAIKSKNKGKSGGARVVTHVYITGSTVYLLDIYDKSDQDSISDKELKELIELLDKK
jgi:mRNA-degrading endonuclease RelE of RelBE toxin-antitoxin system